MCSYGGTGPHPASITQKTQECKTFFFVMSIANLPGKNCNPAWKMILLFREDCIVGFLPRVHYVDCAFLAETFADLGQQKV